MIMRKIKIPNPENQYFRPCDMELMVTKNIMINQW